MKRPEQQGWYWARWGGGPWAACHTAESDLHDEEDPNFEWGVRILEPGEGPDVARALELLRELKWPARMYEYERGVQEAIAALDGAVPAPELPEGWEVSDAIVTDGKNWAKVTALGYLQVEGMVPASAVRVLLGGTHAR